MKKEDIKFFRDLFYGTLIELFIGLLIMALLQGCTPTAKMPMPTGCEPEKQIRYKMVEPTLHKHDKRFMVYQKKTKYDYDKEKEFQRTGK